MKGGIEDLFKTFIAATFIIIVLVTFLINPSVFEGFIGPIFADPMFIIIAAGMIAIIILAILLARSG